MTYEEAMRWLEGVPAFSVKRYDLDAVSRLLERLGNPDKKLKYIHIAGTNGKGSTAAFCSSSLFEAGFKTGLFISPHVLSYRERIQIDGKMISRAELLKIIELIRPHVEFLENNGIVCSNFDITTAIAMSHFYSNNCDIVVLEAGMGGRLDSTNVILPPEIAILTHISRDHTSELGEDIAQIAKEKAGILKPGSACICDRNQPAAVKKVVDSICLSKGVELVYTHEPCVKVCDSSENVWTYGGVRYRTKLIGQHQISNAMLAVTALLKIGIDVKYIKRGIYFAHIPARLEKICETPLTILDGAHNPDGMTALSKSLTLFKKTPLIGVVSMLKTKDYRAALTKIKDRFDKLIITEMDFDGAVRAECLFKAATDLKFNALVEKNPQIAIKIAKNLAGRDGAVVLFGSLYFCSQVRNILLD